MERLKQSKLMFWSVWALVIATFIFMCSKISFLFSPLGTFFSTLFAPVLIAGFLYYVLNPLVKLLEKFKVKRIIAIILVLLLLVGLLAVAVMAIFPNLFQQLSSLASNVPTIYEDLEKWLRSLANEPFFKKINLTSYLNSINIDYGGLAQKFFNQLSTSMGSLITVIGKVGMVLITVPFMLFYMLKDGDKFLPAIRKMMPKSLQDEAVELLKKMNETISTYISGQAIECLFVGTFTFIGYLLVGVDYAFLFGITAGLTNLIPYLGPYLGLLPAVIVTLFTDPIKAIWCCVVVLIVQQLDGNIIYPNVIGKTLEIHPLTIIVILLVAGNLSGLLGVFLGVPVYAILRTVVRYVYNILQLSKHNKEAALAGPADPAEAGSEMAEPKE